MFACTWNTTVVIELIEYLLLIKEPAETYEKSHCTVSSLYYVNEEYVTKEYLAIRVADPKGQGGHTPGSVKIGQDTEFLNPLL